MDHSSSLGLPSSAVRRSERPLLYKGARDQVHMGAQHSVWPRVGTPHVATSLPRASAGLFSHQPSAPALPTSRGVEECTLESALEAENTPLLLLFLGTVLLSPCPPPPANGGGILQSVDHPASGEALPTHLTQPSPPSQGILTQLSFHPLLTSGEVVSRAPGMG